MGRSVTEGSPRPRNPQSFADVLHGVARRIYRVEEDKNGRLQVDAAQRGLDRAIQEGSGPAALQAYDHLLHAKKGELSPKREGVIFSRFRVPLSSRFRR